MKIRVLRVMALVVVVAFTLTACEQLAGLQNYNSRIKGDWQTYDGGFMSDSVYEFSSGIINKDGFEWGTYNFLRRDELEVTLGDQPAVYFVEFVDDDTMVWFQMSEGKRFNRYEWRR